MVGRSATASRDVYLQLNGGFVSIAKSVFLVNAIIVEPRLRHASQRIMAQGCDMDPPLVGEHPTAPPPGGPAPGAAPGNRLMIM